MTNTKFAVSFAGLGYYADKQPHYNWSFTKDVESAKLYKTKAGAEERALLGLQLARQARDSGNKTDNMFNAGKTATIHEIEVEEITTKNVISEVEYAPPNDWINYGKPKENKKSYWDTE